MLKDTYRGGYNSLHEGSIPSAERFLKWVITGYFVASVASNILFGSEPLGGSADELVTLVLCVSVLVMRGSSAGLASISGSIILIAAFAFAGFASAVFNSDLAGYPRYQAALIGIFLDLKVYLAAFSIFVLLGRMDPSQIERIVIYFCKLSICIALLNLAFCLRDVLDGARDIHGRPLMLRAGLAIPNGIYPLKVQSVYATVLGLVCAATLSLRGIRTGRYVLLSFVFFVGVVIHLSVKEIAASLALIGLCLFLASRTFAKLYALVWVVLIFLAVGFTDNPITNAFEDRVQVFLLNDTTETVRSALYDRSAQIAIDYFPFGSGAGTFGSMPSRDLQYSPIYHKYGISQLYGGYGTLESGGEFLMDVFWPKVLAEAGMIGFSCYLLFWCRILFWAARGAIRVPDAPSIFGFLFVAVVMIISLATPIITRADAVLPLSLALACVMQRRASRRSAVRRLSGAHPAVLRR